jgi:preprotein translocase subunit SecG
MNGYQIALAITTILTAIIITVLVMLQESKQQGLTGVISGGADNLFGKSRGRSFEDKLVNYTKYLTVFFFVLTLGTTLLLLFFNRPAA